ncbi:MAG: type III pantothenate kinase [Ruminococcus sp.]|nr:type III pantothenate kinase [Ruminococcus sp.]
MVLAVDIGNTYTVVGGFDRQGEILFTERISTDHKATDFEYARSFTGVLDMHGAETGDIEGAVISSVVPIVTGNVRSAVKKITGAYPITVGPGIKTGLSIKIDDPAQLGSDLVVGAVAGINLYPCPLVIIDMGTATIMSVINRDKSYIGGMILPGVKISMEALTERTSQLPKIGFEPPRKLIGSNTVECMKSGLLYGSAACIDGMLQRISEELGEQVTAVATGSLAGTVAGLCRSKIICDNDLMLKGLTLIYNKNSG